MYIFELVNSRTEMAENERDYGTLGSGIARPTLLVRTHQTSAEICILPASLLLTILDCPNVFKG